MPQLYITKSFLPPIYEKKPLSVVKPLGKPEKSFKLPKLFALTQTQVRDELERLKQEKLDRTKYDAIITKLPKINAELQTKMDYFSKFFGKIPIEEEPDTFQDRSNRFVE
uniref:Uncharacterized protein n=1 Tax=Acrobeloides nanus TaxID=290746 RepID=A0A914CWS9_9BILA